MSDKPRLGLFGRRKQKAVGDPVSISSPILVDALRLFEGEGSWIGYGTVYRKLHPVRTVVDFIADAIATTPLKFYRRNANDRTELRDHPAAQVVAHPNPELTDKALIGNAARDLLIYGNAYIRKVQTGNSRFLVPLPPFRVTPQGGDLLGPSYFDFYPPNGSAPKRLSRDEVCHLHLYDPEDRRVGSSKLEALRTILREEVEASRYRTGYWDNKAAPDGVLQHPGNLSEEALDRLRVDWQNRAGGYGNSGKTLILEEGMEYAPISHSPNDAQFIEGRQFILEATAHVFNLPLPLLSLTQTATYASQREFHKQLYTEVLPPWLETFTSEFELQLLPWFGEQDDDLYYEFNVESKLRGDFIDQVNVISKALGGGSTPGWMVVSEARKLFNLPELEDPRADALVVPMNVDLGLPGDEPEPAAIAPVTPIGRSAAAANGFNDRLADFYARQDRSVRSKMGAGEAFDFERWDRELAAIVGSHTEAHRLNVETARRLTQEVS
jgi:HK97 family phage portal protein